MITLDDVKNYFNENEEDKEVAEFVAGLKKIELPEVVDFLETTDEGQRYLRSEKDRHFDKAIETWKANSLPNLLKEERDKVTAELNPAETPEQKRLKELEDKLAEQERQSKAKESELALERISNEAKDLLSGKGIPIALTKFVAKEDKNNTDANIAEIEKIWREAVNDAVAKRLRRDGVDPPKSKQVSGDEFSKLPAPDRLSEMRRKNIVYKEDEG